MRKMPAVGPNEFYYLLADHLGTTTGVLDANGALVSQQKYWPYGTLRSGGIAQTDKLLPVAEAGYAAESRIGTQASLDRCHHAAPSCPGVL